jgi:hypothetical protein
LNAAFGRRFCLFRQFALTGARLRSLIEGGRLTAIAPLGLKPVATTLIEMPGMNVIE